MSEQSQFTGIDRLYVDTRNIMCRGKPFTLDGEFIDPRTFRTADGETYHVPGYYGQRTARVGYQDITRQSDGEMVGTVVGIDPNVAA